MMYHYDIFFDKISKLWVRMCWLIIACDINYEYRC